MTPDRKKTIGSVVVTEYYWAGSYAVYVNHLLSELTFEEACRAAEESGVAENEVIMGQQKIGVRCIHKLKTWPQFFDAVASGVKGFELRKDDRGFQVGDVLLLQECDQLGNYSGREVSRLVLYMLNAASFSGIEKGYCILGLGMLPQYAAEEIYNSKQQA